MKPTVYLIGVPGSGKTSVGRALAALRGLDFVQTDDLVAARAGRPGAEVLLHEGEDAFRALERAALGDVLGRGGVVALGGGCLDSPAAREAFAPAATPPSSLVVLTMDTPTMAARLGLNRPRSVGLGAPRAQLRLMAQARMRTWRSFAPLVVDTSHTSPAEAAERIAAALWPDE